MEEIRVLVVEDEGIVAKDIQNTLRRLGYSVPAMAASAEAAIEKATEIRPDLVLMDIRLRGEMDGVTAAGTIRAHLDVPVVFLTAHADARTFKRALATEPFGYILKPFEERELVTNIEMALYKHRMERRLRESEQRFRALIENASDIIVVLRADGSIQYTSPAVKRFGGYEPEELVDQNAFALIHPDEVEIAREIFVQILAHPFTPYRQELRFRRKDGGWLALEGFASNLLEEPAVSGIVINLRDVTEQKRIQANLIQAEKLAALGQLAASLAHEISNPLQLIIGHLELAQEDLGEKEVVAEHLAAIHAEVQRLSRTVTSIRDLSRRRSSWRERANVNALIEQVLDLSRKQCQYRGVRIRWDPELNLPAVILVPDQIKQVLLNLLLNAIEALPDGGWVEVNTARTDDPVGVRITFTDNGTGIPPDVMPHIFEPFFSTKAEGIGLGLFISQNIMQQHGGHIEVQSSVGTGSTFSLWLPEETRSEHDA
jgi:PAS domain S-box-containing protein